MIVLQKNGSILGAFILIMSGLLALTIEQGFLSNKLSTMVSQSLVQSYTNSEEDNNSVVESQHCIPTARGNRCTKVAAKYQIMEEDYIQNFEWFEFEPQKKCHVSSRGVRCKEKGGYFYANYQPDYSQLSINKSDCQLSARGLKCK